MGLLSLINNPTFDDNERRVLTQWYTRLGDSASWRLIQRNIDVECERQDIDPMSWELFLKDVAAKFDVSVMNPVATIDDCWRTSVGSYLLRGFAIPVLSPEKLCRFERLDRFHKRALHPLGALLEDPEVVLTLLRAGDLDGSDIAGAEIGSTDKPVWVAVHADVENVMPQTLKPPP
jgi:hypothetical protein